MNKESSTKCRMKDDDMQKNWKTGGLFHPKIVKMSEITPVGGCCSSAEKANVHPPGGLPLGNLFCYAFSDQMLCVPGVPSPACFYTSLRAARTAVKDLSS